MTDTHDEARKALAEMCNAKVNDGGGKTWTAYASHTPERPVCISTFPSTMQAIAALVDAQDAQIAALREALDRIIQWSDAYPLGTFPEPDFDAVAKALADAGLSLGAVSASNMRHAVKGAANIARSALEDEANE